MQTRACWVLDGLVSGGESAAGEMKRNAEWSDVQ